MKAKKISNRTAPAKDSEVTYAALVASPLFKEKMRKGAEHIAIAGLPKPELFR